MDESAKTAAEAAGLGGNSAIGAAIGRVSFSPEEREQELRITALDFALHQGTPGSVDLVNEATRILKFLKGEDAE